MARSCAGKAPTSEIKKKKGKTKSPVTGQEEGPRVKTRSSVAWGMAKSPGGTEHKFIPNSGITPDGASDEVKAVLRGALHHSGQPGCSETRLAMVSDSSIAMRKGDTLWTRREFARGGTTAGYGRGSQELSATTLSTWHRPLNASLVALSAVSECSLAVVSVCSLLVTWMTL